MADKEFDATVLAETEEALNNLRARLGEFAGVTQQLGAGQEAMSVAGRHLVDLATAQQAAAEALKRAATAIANAAPDQLADQLKTALELLHGIEAEQVSARNLVHQMAQSLGDQSLSTTKAVSDLGMGVQHTLAEQMKGPIELLRTINAEQIAARALVQELVQGVNDQSAATRKALAEVDTSLRQQIALETKTVADQLESGLGQLRETHKKDRMWMFVSMALGALSIALMVVLLMKQ